ncbi:MAG: hypothetical protein ABIC36_02955 [bacterium]
MSLRNLKRYGFFRRQLSQSTAKVVTLKAVPVHLSKAWFFNKDLQNMFFYVGYKYKYE